MNLVDGIVRSPTADWKRFGRDTGSRLLPRLHADALTAGQASLPRLETQPLVIARPQLEAILLPPKTSTSLRSSKPSFFPPNPALPRGVSLKTSPLALMVEPEASVTTASEPPQICCSCSHCLNSGTADFAHLVMGDVAGSTAQPAVQTIPKSSSDRTDALLVGSKWTSPTVTYSFFSGGSYYGSQTGLMAISEPIKQHVRHILKTQIEPLINVNFIEMPDSADSYGQIRYVFSSMAGAAYTYLPSDSPLGGDVHLNPNYQAAFEAGPGTFRYETLIHETMHALGLKHPGNYDSAGTPNPPYLGEAEDNGTNTLMSYNRPANWGVSPMPYDIRALQYLYGARSTRSDDTVYQFSSVYGYRVDGQFMGSDRPIKQTIWDNGGVDTLDFSQLDATQSYRFDLQENGILTTTSAYNGTTYKHFTSGESFPTHSYGTAIAYGTTLENLIGTAAADTISGNAVANDLRGGAGDDQINGLEGDDRLWGEAGNDHLDGDSGSDFLNGGMGNDFLNGGTGADWLEGGAGDDRYLVDHPQDQVRELPNEGNDLVYTSVDYQLPDQVEKLALLGNQSLRGDGNALNNSIKGSEAANTIDGKAGNDTLWGMGGNDRLIGGTGHDFLIGGAGNDELIGGAGSDRFLFYSLSEGVDRLLDFQTGTDKIMVDQDNFGGDLALGALEASQFTLGAIATSASHRFLYNTSDGGLWFDRDGTGSASAIQFAILGNASSLNPRDIVVI